ncbi:MAG: L-fucose:H+ symporter permease [Gemmatimonadales bacterium]|nr:L-fucose:H+ symporter permease [Gemmatimonadales bacterium]
MTQAAATPAAAPHGPGPARVISGDVLVPFVLITILFPLWGFANDVTNPMVKAFSRILMMSNFEGSLVQFAFYGGYFAMAFPAALFIKRYSYKAGILMGLGLYAGGALLFIPGSWAMVFWPFLVAYFVLTCGLSFLETAANPYILAMGSPRTATRRLNFAQSFNPMGSLLGMFVAQQMILARLDPATAAERAALATDQLRSVTAQDLAVVRVPYVGIALVIAVVFAAIALTRMPRHGEEGRSLDVGRTLRRLLGNPRYVEGVVAQFFYVGAQIMCWTFIIHYATMELGLSEVAAQGYNIAAMVVFVTSRFICTFLLRYVSPGRLLMTLAVGGGLLTLGTIMVQGMVGLYCLVGISACMSLMFPTIYGIALRGLGEDAKLGAAGLIMAILGGSVMPPLQGAIIDLGTIHLGAFSMAAVRASFVLPLICFVVVARYGRRAAGVYSD